LLCLALTLSAVAHAETVTVVSPLAEGADTSALAAELGLALDRALAHTPRFQRVNEGPLLPDELRTTFGCLTLDTRCVLQAGNAAGTALVLWPRVIRLKSAIELRVALVDVARAAPARELVRYLRFRDPGPRAEASGAGPAMRAMADALFADAEPFEAAILPLSTGAVRVDARAATPNRALSVTPGAHRVLFSGIPSTEVVVQVGRGELVVVNASSGAATQVGASPRRIGVWMTAGASALSLGGALALGASLAGTQNDYDRTQNGLEMMELREQGDNLALATNVLIGVGATAALVSAYLFLSE
jgi:hypothetical protein